MGGIHDLGKSFYTVGEMMLYDDIDDLGYFTYKGRKNHYYHGVHSPDHNSPFHHWQWSAWLMLAGHLLSYVDIAKALQEDDDEDEDETVTTTASQPTGIFSSILMTVPAQ